MADNYLERRMEDYRAGKIGTTHKSARRPSASAAREPLKLNILIVGTDAPVIRPLIENYIGKGCKVAFALPDSSAGTALAQATGAQFHPMTSLNNDDASAFSAALSRSLAHINRHWGQLHTIILLDPTPEILSTVTLLSTKTPSPINIIASINAPILLSQI